MRFFVLTLVITLAGCGATIQTHERLSQETGRELSTHVGGQVREFNEHKIYRMLSEKQMSSGVR